MKNNEYIYREGVGQDPQQVEMLADVYGWQVVWPEQKKVDRYDPVGSFLFSVLFLCWMAPAVCWAFPKRKASVVVLLCFSCLALGVVSQAATVTSTYTFTAGDGIAEVTANFNSGPNTVTWSRRLVSTGSGGAIGTHGYGAAWMYRVAANGSTTSLQTIFSLGAASGTDTTVTGSFTPVAGAWYYIAARVQYSGTNAVAAGPEEKWFIAGTYSITFNIPANNTDHAVHYQVLQGGEVIETHVQEPGASPYILQLVGLESDEPVTLEEVLVNREIGEDPLNPGSYITVGYTATSVAEVSSGTPTLSGSTGSTVAPPSPATGETVKSTPAETVTPAPSVDAPTPSTPVSGPIPVSSPFDAGDEADTDAATTGDIAKSTTGIIEAVNAVAEAVNDNSNGIIEAIDNNAVAVTDGANGIIEAVNNSNDQSKTTGDAIIAALDGIKAQLAKQAGTSDGPGSATEPAGVINPADQDAAWEPGDYNVATVVTGKLPVAPTIDTTVPAVSAFTIEFEIPVPHGTSIVVNETIDFGQPPYAAPIAIFRGIMVVFVTLGFYFLTFWTIRGAFTTTK